VKPDFTTTTNYRRHYKKFHLNILIDGDPLTNTSIVRRLRTIVDFWSSSRPVVSFKRGNSVAFDQEVFIKLLINFIILNSLALRIVESIPLRQLLEYCLADIQIPSYQTMMKIMLSFYKEALETVRTKLQQHIADGSRICLTGDGWSASNGDSYLGVTAHWTDVRWTTHSILLEFVQMPPSHTSKAYFEALITACNRFSIHNYILSITTDNHVVNDRMCDRFEKHAFKSAEQGFEFEPPPAIFKAEDGHIRCLAHSINLSAQAILSSLKSSAEEHTSVLYDDTKFIGKASYGSAIGKARRIIVRYRRSSLMKAALARQCAAHRVKILKLFLDIEVRWNSTYTMLKRFLELESPIRSLLAAKDSKDYDITHLSITASEWEFLKALCEVFSYYQPVTLKMSAQAYPTLYNVLPQFIILRSQLVAAIRQNGGVGVHSPLATGIQAGVDKLDEYLDKAKLQSIAAIATILNPRMKLHKLRELGWTSVELSRDRQAVIDTFDAYLTRFSQAEDEVDAEDDDLDDELALYGIINPVALSPIKSFGTEVERYLLEPLLKKSDKKTYAEF
jgi:Domain of unknown function (DUF4413)